MIFEKRTAFITGAAGLIGSALARELGRYGVTLYLADRHMPALNELAEELTASGVEAHAVELDVTKPAAIRHIARAVQEQAGAVDILVNNAGQWPEGSIISTSDALWRRVIDLNLTSVFRVSKAFVPGMMKRKFGRIINLGSIAGEVGLPGRCAYSVAKAGVIMLTKTMAMELAETGITVNSISPGMIWREKVPHLGTWLGRTGTADEVARAITFLASDRAGYITGADLPVDGGRILGPKSMEWKL